MSSINTRFTKWINSFRSRIRSDTSNSDTANLVDSNNAHSSSRRAESSDYTELMGGSVPCPSCNGSGRIPKELEGTLVALIPVNDERLKPRKTCIWISLVIIVCVLLASGAFYILMPRQVTLNGLSYPIEVVNVYDQDNVTHTKISFFFTNFVNVSNGNYFPIDVVNISATIFNRWQPWATDKVGNGGNGTAMKINPLSGNKAQLYFNNTVQLTGSVAEYCQAPYSHLTSLYVNLQFDITVTLRYYYGHEEQVTTSATQMVCCIPSGNCTHTW
uniref:Uncharacterized protein n=1 Tax=Acrobeloides nanus TaxID=290746 RepID=A0A914C279_9BILA